MGKKQCHTSAYKRLCGTEKLLCVYEEKDLGLVILDKLTWDPHLHLITAKVNKLLGLLKRSCTMLTKVAVGKSL